ncbi:MAG: FecR domain-containing protein [Gemmataceae bacterium]
MTHSHETEALQAYLDGELDPAAARALEERLKQEPELANQLMWLACSEASFREWSGAQRICQTTTPEARPPAAARRRPLAFDGLPGSAFRRFTRAVLWSGLAATVLLALVGIVSPPPAALGGSKAIAALEEVQGEVRVVTGAGETVLAQSGQSLFSGQEVCTGGEGSYAVVRYPDGTRVELSTETTICLLQDGGATLADIGKHLFLATGFVNANVSDPIDDQPLVMTTPHAIIRVLGRPFRVAAASTQVTRVELEEGRVQMTRKIDGQSIEVAEGSYAVADINNPRFTPLLLPPRITQARQVFTCGAGPVLDLAFAPEGAMLAAAGWDSPVYLWDLHTGVPQTARMNHKRRIRSLAFRADGSLLATGSEDRFIKIWNLSSHTELLTLPKQRMEVDAVAFSPDGRLLASAGYSRDPQPDAGLRLWDAVTGAEIVHLLGHRKKVKDVSFSPDGVWLATASADHTVRIWDVAQRREQVTLQGHVKEVNAVVFSPDGAWLASGSRDGTVKLWDAQTWQLRRTLQGHAKEVRALAFAPDSRMLASGGGDTTVRLWDMGTGREWKSFKGHKYTVCAVAFSPDGNTLASSGWDRTVKLWDLIASEPDMSIAR